MKVLTDKPTFEKWFVEDYLNINHNPLNPSILTDEELGVAISESAPESFPCLVFVEAQDIFSGGNQLRYVYKDQVRLMQELLEGKEFTH
jgi:hypothetical protein